MGGWNGCGWVGGCGRVVLILPTYSGNLNRFYEGDSLVSLNSPQLSWYSNLIFWLLYIYIYYGLSN